ncbi:MAG: phosphate ABC transporter substrate-binding/OmpA family protein [Spirosomaceae bacterium]|nr:phosphate ABC transporter substrate-binding/OmpA family protein [Spirosomataceae bacterium]
MKTRLTPFSKLLMTVGIVAAVFFGGKWLLDNTSFGKNLKSQSESEGSSSGSSGGLFSSSSDSDDVIKIGVVTWGGYAGGQYFNNGFKPNADSRFKEDYGFDVEFKVLDDFEASRAAWKNGEVDLLWTTIDAFPTEADGLSDFAPQVVFQADWSRGGDAIVVRRGISSVADLKGKKIAVAELTPSHSFLLYLLEAGGLKMSDVQIVKQASAIDAAAVFKAQQVDAAVVWSPDDALAVQAVPGSKILQSTKSATNIIADVFIAKRSWVENNQTRLQQLYEGWMKGAAEINNNPAAKKKASQILADQFQISAADAEQTIDNVRLATHGDNLNFFGRNADYRGVTGEQLYTRMGGMYQNLGYVDKVVNWRLISNPIAVSKTNLSGFGYEAEGQKDFSVATAEEAKGDAIASKQVSINFRTAEYQLSENAKYIVDKEMAEIAKAFAGARIRVEGNTDNVGGEAANVALSKRRAQSVVDYLVANYGMNRNRFIVVGNGPKNPVASNDSESGRAQNRRTDFQIVE